MTARALFWIDSIASSSYNGIFARTGTIMGSNYYLNLDKWVQETSMPLGYQFPQLTLTFRVKIID